MGNGEITTNHLIPFAGDPDGEWAFCFDSFNENFPVYYHHQDTPRARLKSNNAWDPSTSEKPEFAGFESWIEWLVSALENGKDPGFLGEPNP